MYDDPSVWELGLIAAIILAASVRDRLESDPDPIEEAKRLYAEGMIDEPELERRIEEAVDDDHEAIRLVVEDVNGVSDSRSKAIAREYDSLDELRASDREKLEGVPGIGEELAEAVLERVRSTGNAE
ncbi:MULTISPECIES: helix-hairpin-helix domain-containing protein [Halobacteriales]|uniref:Helix-hairpin-helix domain-containing protein n=2 Tax=Halobacteriales TaxID=2235 RepID=A0A1I0QYW2_9EURY|nr:helix-hairpin-helix domain-containing protein [Natrinema salifodinae]SEW32981.1 Helix-hairpin-helix domain-containing protein [Natrinema salifodinae]